MLSSGVRLGVGWCVRLPEGLVSLCLPLYPFLFPLVGWCVRLAEGLLSLCLPLYPSCFPLLDGTSAFPRDLSPFVSHSALSCFPLLDFPFVSHGAPSCFPLLDGASGLLTSCLPLPPIVSHCLRARVPVLDGASAFSTSSLSLLSPIVSSTCVPVLDGVSAFPRSCLPVYPCLPLSPHMCACMFWMVCSPSRGLVSPCRLPSRGLVYPCLPLNQLSPIVSHCLRTRVPVFDGASAFTTSCLPFLSPIVTPHMCACDGLSA